MRIGGRGRECDDCPHWLTEYIHPTTVRLWFHWVEWRSRQMTAPTVWLTVCSMIVQHGLVLEEIAFLAPSAKCTRPRQTTDIEVVGQAFFDLPDWWQPILWYRFTLKETEWREYRKKSSRSKKRWTDIMLGLQKNLWMRDPTIYPTEMDG